MTSKLALALIISSTTANVIAAEKKPLKISGIYPHLAHTNTEREVGIGAIVPWAGSLWTNTYGPHLPHGSTDKLRQIDKNWNMVERPESVGGTPANRMIHRETNQLIIGHHLIDKDGKVRTIDPKVTMPGRITANARHLTDPKNKLYYFTMEDGLYEVDMHTLAVKAVIKDPINISETHLPGYHGKGAYTGSGRLIVSNNGEPKQTSPSGCLATWNGKDWKIEARNQFVEVTGPGGIYGNTDGDDRVWTTGWDAKSVRLMVLEDGKWTKFRLPKGSYTHDANHGWNTEWPRIRPVNDDLTLMHMHGLFFDFPQTFSAKNYGGLKPISTYVKMPVDYAWYNGKLVISKDDASMFDNAFVKQSQSNLWIGDIAELSTWGPKSGFGGVWLHESFDADQASEPFLVGGFKNGTLHLQHNGGYSVPVEIQVDAKGTGDWKSWKTVKTNAKTGYLAVSTNDINAEWVRLVNRSAVNDMTAYFQLNSPYVKRNDTAQEAQFGSLADVTETAPAGAHLQLPYGWDMKLNAFTEDAIYQFDQKLEKTKKDLDAAAKKVSKAIAVKQDPTVGVDASSAFIHFKDANGNQMTMRLPKGNPAFDATVGKTRHIREIVTERTALNLHGTFYELPRPKPGHFKNYWQMKPIGSHNKHIYDYCSWRGMLVFSGAKAIDNANSRSLTANSGLWFGEVDDLWKMGKPQGQGGPWLNTAVKKKQPSDPYLMLGYENKSLTLSHHSSKAVSFEIQVDFLGNGEFSTYQTVAVKAGESFKHNFPKGFAAHWIRFVAKENTKATAQLNYH